MSRWILFALIVSTLSVQADTLADLGEIKIYPAPGKMDISNIEVGEPTAGRIYRSLRVPIEKIDDQESVYLQKNTAEISCIERQTNVRGGVHFCVMHVAQSGALGPGVEANFEESPVESPLARGIGKIGVETMPNSIRLSIGGSAATALATNLQHATLNAIKCTGPDGNCTVDIAR